MFLDFQGKILGGVHVLISTKRDPLASVKHVIKLAWPK